MGAHSRFRNHIPGLGCRSMPVQSLICLGIKVSLLVGTRPVRKQYAYGLYSHAETSAQTLSDYQFCLSLRALSFHLGQHLGSTHGHKPHVSLPLLHRGFPLEQRKFVTNRLEETLMSQSNPPISSTLYGFYGHFSKMCWQWPPNTLCTRSSAFRLGIRCLQNEAS